MVKKYPTYSLWITIKKGLFDLMNVAVSGGVTAMVNFVGAMSPEATAGVWGVVFIGLKMFENFWKHKDWDLFG